MKRDREDHERGNNDARPEPRRYHIETWGCQMNVHDSEKVSNLLLHAG